MENRIYKVTFEVKTSDVEDWFEDSYTVLANGDAMKAVQKARKWAEKDHAEPYKDEDTGKRVTPKVQGWRLTGIHIVAEAQVV